MTVICNVDDLIENSGVCALHKNEQVAIFYLPNEENKVYAIDNFDPFSKANVISRGIIGSISGKKVVASPLYKQHFDLLTGQCLEDETVTIKTYPVELSGNQVCITA